MITTTLTRTLGVEHPIISAPMAGVAGASLADAVSAAGGLGLLGGGYGDPAWLTTQLDRVAPNTIGVGFITWRLARQPRLLDIALDYEPRAIFLSFGALDAFAPRIATHTSLFIAQVQSLKDAKQAADLGADIIVAQGSEAGGHSGRRATLALVPAVVDAVAPIPVAAAGGIADGRGLAAALMLGAHGVVMGTRFYCARESLAPPAARDRAIAGSGDDTVKSAVFDILRGYDWPPGYALRTLGNALTARYAAAPETLGADRQAHSARYEQAVLDQDYDTAAVIVGEALDLFATLKPAADIVSEVIDTATRLLAGDRHFSVSS